MATLATNKDFELQNRHARGVNLCQVRGSQTVLAMLIGLLCLLQPSPTLGQGNRKFDAAEYFKKLDRNGNGDLDEEELNEKSRRYVAKLGYDTDRRISLRRLLRSIEKRDEREQESANQNQNGQSSNVLVPGFGEPVEKEPLAGFGLDGSGSSGNIEYSEETWKLLNYTLKRYDRNEDGVIDREEMKRAPWGNPRPEESDTNNDGILTRDELLLRYHVREASQKDSRSDRDDDPKRDDRKDESDRDRDRGRDRDWGGRRGSDDRGRNERGSDRDEDSKSSKRSPRDDREKFLKYAKSLIDNYDKDDDRRLSKEEWKAVRRPPANADGNKDGFVTEQEYANALGAKSGPDNNVSRLSVKRGNNRARNQNGNANLGNMDANGDAQVQMHEYSNEWDAAKLEEFYEIDHNRDGVITQQEWQQQ